jgi:hypothetical protein
MATVLAEEQKAARQRFRERIGVSEEKRRYQRQWAQERKAVRAALAAPATVPEIAAASGLPAHTVLWHVTAMRKYGQAREVDQDGDYPRYALIEEPEAT